MEIKSDLETIRRHFFKAHSSNLHVSMATVNPDGTPWVTPIGSFLLQRNGVGIYFEMFPKALTRNLEKNPNVVVMAVNSGFWFWLKSILRGGFSISPALRLIGRVGELRDPTEEEVKVLSKRFDLFKGTKGHKLMWSRVSKVREIHFTDVAPVRIGRMTE